MVLYLVRRGHFEAKYDSTHSDNYGEDISILLSILFLCMYILCLPPLDLNIHKTPTKRGSWGGGCPLENEQIQYLLAISKAL